MTRQKKTCEGCKFVTTREECQRNIRGVCEGCGGPLVPIETVDNSGRPTFWQGCEPCSCFRSGVDEKYFRIARKMVEDGKIIPYSHMRRGEYENTPQRLAYYLHSQTAGLSHTIKRIHRLLQADDHGAYQRGHTEGLRAASNAVMDIAADYQSAGYTSAKDTAEYIAQHLARLTFESEQKP